MNEGRRGEGVEPTLHGHVVEVAGRDDDFEGETDILLELLDVVREFRSRHSAHDEMLAGLVGDFEEESTVVQFRHAIFVMGTVRFGDNPDALRDFGVGGIVVFFGEVHGSVDEVVCCKRSCPTA